MDNYSDYMNKYRESFVNHRGWFLVLGILLIALGMFAIAADVWTTLITVVFLGSVLLVGGIFLIADAIKFWWHKWEGFFLHLGVAVLYIIAGLMLLSNPMLGSVTLTLLLGATYLVVGIFRVIYAVSTRFVGWGWWVFSGIVSALLGGLILAHWPQASLFIIGLFVGIDLIIAGVVYVSLALSAKSLPPQGM